MTTTPATTATEAEIIDTVFNYTLAMSPFFDLMEREIEDHNCDSFDNAGFLLKAAKAETFRLSAYICELKERDQTVASEAGPVKQHSPAVESCRALFGDHPEDVISPINAAAETLMQLEEIFKTISSEALQERNGYRIKRLADAGAHIALDIGSYADHAHESMTDHLRAAGAIPAEV